MSRVYGFASLNTGVEGSLNFIDGANLLDEDMAFGVVSGVYRPYYLDADSGAAESIPDVVMPLTNAGTKRWRLSTITGTSSMVYPDAGISISSGSAWSTSLTGSQGDNVFQGASAWITAQVYLHATVFGADKTGSIDSTDAIQDAIDAAYAQGGGTVFIEAGTYKIGSASPFFLTMRPHVLVKGAGGGILSAPNAGVLSGTILLPVHGATHYAVFTGDQTTNSHNCGVSDLSIDFSTDTGGTPSAQTADIGFHITGAKIAVNMRLENIVVKNAYTAYHDDTGTFMSTIKNFWSYRCRNGFYKHAGTTTNFQNCYHNGSMNESYDGFGWYLSTTYDCTLTGCACDQVYASRCNTFISNHGLVINGFDFESNRATTSSPYYGIILYFDSNEGLVINGLASYDNAVYINNTDSLEGYLVVIRGKTSGYSSFTLNGLHIGTSDKCYGTGDGTAALAIGNAADTMFGSLNGCKIIALTAGDGYTGFRYAIDNTSKAGSSISKKGCNATVDVDTNSTINTGEGGVPNPAAIALGSVLVANTANTLTALTSTTGTKILRNDAGVWSLGTTIMLTNVKIYSETYPTLQFGTNLNGGTGGGITFGGGAADPEFLLSRASATGISVTSIAGTAIVFQVGGANNTGKFVADGVYVVGDMSAPSAGAFGITNVTAAGSSGLTYIKGYDGTTAIAIPVISWNAGSPSFPLSSPPSGTGFAAVSSGAWTTTVATPLPILNGGTASTTASAARFNLGLEIGVNIQAYNSNLTAINQALTTSSQPTFAGVISTNNMVLSNTVAYQSKDSGGTARSMLAMGGDNIVYLSNPAAGKFIYLGSANADNNPIYIRVGGADKNITIDVNGFLKGV